MAEELEKKEAEQEEKVEVEVVDDAPTEDKTPTKPVKAKSKDGEDDDELLNYSESVQKRINKLKRESHEFRRAKEAAERERSEAVELAKNLLERQKHMESRATLDRGALLANAEARVTTQLNAAKQALKDAFAASDADKIAEANEAIAKLSIEAERINRYKAAAMQQRKAPPQERQGTPLQQGENVVQPSPTVPRPDQKALDWAKRNTWFGTDDEMTGTAYGVHQKLVRNGVDPRSDEYYEAIDATMRKRFPEAFEETNDATDDSGEQTPPPQKAVVKTAPRPSTVVAPAVRTNSGSKKVVLTQSQASLARRLGVPYEEYARQVEALKGTANG